MKMIGSYLNRDAFENYKVFNMKTFASEIDEAHEKLVS